MNEQLIIKSIVEDDLQKFKELFVPSNTLDANLDLDTSDSATMVRPFLIPISSNQTVLHIAAFHDSLKIFQYLVNEKQFSLDQPNLDGYLPLHLACCGGSERVAAYILEIKPDQVKFKIDEEKCFHFLFLAVFGHNSNIVQLLLEKGVDPNSLNLKDNPIKAAIHFRDLDSLKILLQHKARFPSSPNDSALISALRLCFFEAVPILLEAGEDPSIPIQNRDSFYEYPLSLACFYQNVDSVRAICSKYSGNIEPNLSVHDYPVHWIGISGSPEIARIILQYPIDVNKRNDRGKTFVSYLVDRNLPNNDVLEILEMMKEHGFQINVDPAKVPPNQYYLPPLMEAIDVLVVNVEIVKWFLNNGADVNVSKGQNEKETIFEMVMRIKRSLSFKKVSKLFQYYYPKEYEEYMEKSASNI